MKWSLDHSKFKEAEARKELQKVRQKQLEDAQVNVPQDDYDAIVRKHGGAVKKPKAVPTPTQEPKQKRNVSKKTAPSSSDTEDTDKEEKKKARRRTAHQKAKKVRYYESSSEESDASEEKEDDNEDEVEDAAGEVIPDGINEIGSPPSVPDKKETIKGDTQNMEENIIEEVSQKVPEENTIVEVSQRCLDHSNLLNFVREELPTFCAQGQKFCGAKCMKCEQEFGETLKPSSKKPLYYCPHFEDSCDAVICHACYSVAICDNSNAQKTRRSRRN